MRYIYIYIYAAVACFSCVIYTYICSCGLLLLRYIYIYMQLWPASLTLYICIYMQLWPASLTLYIHIYAAVACFSYVMYTYICSCGLLLLRYIYIYAAVACFSYISNTLILMQVSCQRRFITETWRASSPARPGVGYRCSWRFILLCAGDTAATCSAHHFTCYSAGEYIHAASSRVKSTPLGGGGLRHAIFGLSYGGTTQVVLFLYKFFL